MGLVDSGKVKNVECFIKSTELALEGIDYYNAIARPYQPINKQTMDSVVNCSRRALTEARKVNIEMLNDDYKGLGDHYRNEFIRGLELYIMGYDEENDIKYLQGQIIFDKWGVWYIENFDNISNIKVK